MLLRRLAFGSLICLLCTAAGAQGAGSLCDLHRYPKDCNDPLLISADSEIPNFHRVDADLYRGARPLKGASAQAYRGLADLGVRTIINLEGDKAAKDEQCRINQAFATKEPPIRVIPFHISSPWHTLLFSTSHQQVHDLFQLIQSSPKPVFVHCKYGKDRTGAVVLLYRLKRNELADFKEADAEAHHYKFSRFNFGLKRTLNRYKHDPDKLDDLPAPVVPAMPAARVCHPDPAAVSCR
jgi:protein tyrosine phosphatase (PTP) superfamily phosphohydrolase (DUF442 family)